MSVNKKTVVVILIGAYLGVALAACKSPAQGETTPPTYWVETQGGIIQTNDLERLQKEVPFAIVLPTFLPGDAVKSQHPEFVMVRASDLADYVEVRIFYRQMESPGDRLIEIDEYSSPREWVPNEEMENAYVTFSGIQVLEEKTEVSTLEDPIKMVEAIYYMWNQAGTGFTVYVVGFEDTEARTIVRSLIEQM